MSKLTLQEANTIVDAAFQHGVENRMQPLCVVVLDDGAHILALKRDERASISRPEIAMAKAAGCLGMGLGGCELAKRAEAKPAFYAALAAVFPKGLAPVPGGALIRDKEGELLGAIGITGDTSDNDEACAIAGVSAAGLVAETGD